MRYRVFGVSACLAVGVMVLSSRGQTTRPMSADERQHEIAQLKQQLNQIEARLAALEAQESANGKPAAGAVANLKVPAESLPPGIRKKYVAKGSDASGVYVDASVLPPGIAKKFHEDPNHPGYAAPLPKHEEDHEEKEEKD